MKAVLSTLGLCISGERSEFQGPLRPRLTLERPHGATVHTQLRPLWKFALPRLYGRSIFIKNSHSVAEKPLVATEANYP